MTELDPCPFCGGKAYWDEKNKAPRCSLKLCPLSFQNVFFKRAFTYITNRKAEVLKKS